jgi:hypothetical protein
MTDRDDGLDLDAGNFTVRDYLACWLKDSVKDTVKPKTFEGHEMMVRVHIIPAIGRIKLSHANDGPLRNGWSRGRPSAQRQETLRPGKLGGRSLFDLFVVDRQASIFFGDLEVV